MYRLWSGHISIFLIKPGYPKTAHLIRPSQYYLDKKKCVQSILVAYFVTVKHGESVDAVRCAIITAMRITEPLFIVTKFFKWHYGTRTKLIQP